jgi:hypothetical protein
MEAYAGTSARRVCGLLDQWGGPAIRERVGQVAGGARYDRAIEQLIAVAAVLDRAYHR